MCTWKWQHHSYISSGFDHTGWLPVSMIVAEEAVSLSVANMFTSEITFQGITSLLSALSYFWSTK